MGAFVGLVGATVGLHVSGHTLTMLHCCTGTHIVGHTVGVSVGHGVGNNVGCADGARVVVETVVDVSEV